VVKERKYTYVLATIKHFKANARTVGRL